MEPFIGQIQSFAFNFAPKGWATCQGQILPIAQYNALYALLGTQYGGDGKTTFALPNLGGRVAVGQGQIPGGGTYDMGQASGTETVTLLTSNLPAHTHAFNGGADVVKVSSQPATTPTPSATENTLAAITDPSSSALNNAYNNQAPDITLNIGGSASGTIGITGGGQPFPILQPYLTINYSIALQGLFPSRN